MVKASGESIPAIFLDRDGVIIENREDYVRSWDDVHFFPEALEALARISNLEYKVIIVTNQSPVGRGMISLRVAQEINRRLIEEIQKAGGRIDGVYMCPHSPWDNCDCRKPKPGLFRRAANDHNVDLTDSIMVGDALSDIEAARAAGVGRAALVRTGRGQVQEQLPKVQEVGPFLVYDDLAAALRAMLSLSNAPISSSL